MPCCAGERIECGCGGPAQPLSWLLVARNLGLMGLAALAMFTPPALGGLLATSVALLAGLFAFCLYAIAEQVLANPAPLLARRADPLS